MFLALLFFLEISKIMSKRKAPVITYEDAVQNILAFVENDDMEDELDPLFENQSDDGEFKIEENDAEENLTDDGEEVPEQEELNPRRNRKLLTRNRLVHIIPHLIKIITIRFIISMEIDTGKLLLDI